MKKTKVKILEAALKCFNDQGVVNVRLQHIADEAFISVGNLAYHYPNKEAIVLALYQRISDAQKALLAEYRIVPLFDNIDRLIRQSVALQKEHIFFYLDTLEMLRAYPDVKAAHQTFIQFQIQQWEAILSFNISRGALNPPLHGLDLGMIARQLWSLVAFWRYQNAVLADSQGNEEDFVDAFWCLLKPHFSEIGFREYGQMRQNPYDLFY
ncbi:MAG: TetR/AcrR family transcriptional regulator [Bacteroidota bacterium]